MKALIQKREGEFSSVNACAAFLGFRERGYEIAFFEAPDFDQHEIDGSTVVVGGVPLIHRALQRLGVAAPSLESVPDPLLPFAGRAIWHSTLGAVRARVDAGESIFIKPTATNLKAFAGHVVTTYGDLARTAALPADEPVWCSQTLSMVSEYRVFVCRGQAIGCKHYWGDFRVGIDFSVVESAVTAYRGGPAGCSLDFAATADGRTVLIEVNDGFSLGSYGLNPMLYAGLLEARWEELVAGVTRMAGERQ